MWIVTYLLNLLFGKILPANYFVNVIVVAVLLVIAVIVYFAVLFLLKGLTREELKEFPMGMRIARIATKLRILR